MKTFVVAMSLAVLAGAGIAAQKAAKEPSKAYAAGKTSWGDPNLQGIYTDKDENGIPLERPSQFDGKPGTGRLGTRRHRPRTADARRGERWNHWRSRGAETGAGPVHWNEHYGAKNSRPWIITSRPTARSHRSRSRATAGGRARHGPQRPGEPIRPRIRSLYDQCITRGVLGSMMPGIYGNSFQIVQAPGYVAIRYEMIHETRIIPIDSRPHVGKAPNLHGRRARPLGGEHAGRRNHEFQRNRARISASTATGRDARPFRSSNASRRFRQRGRVEGHTRRSGDVDAAVDVCDEFDQRRDAATFRIRVSRRQLRADNILSAARAEERAGR